MVYVRALLGRQRVYQSPWRRRRPSEDQGFIWQELRTLSGLEEDLRSDEPVPPQSEYSSPCLVHRCRRVRGGQGRDTMARLGLAISGGLAPTEIVECVKLAEDLGYESAWVAEGQGGDQFGIRAACA